MRWPFPILTEEDAPTAREVREINDVFATTEPMDAFRPLHHDAPAWPSRPTPSPDGLRVLLHNDIRSHEREIARRQRLLAHARAQLAALDVEPAPADPEHATADVAHTNAVYLGAA
jgi:hypothetical protein